MSVLYNVIRRFDADGSVAIGLGLYSMIQNVYRPNNIGLTENGNVVEHYLACITLQVSRFKKSLLHFIAKLKYPYAVNTVLISEGPKTSSS